MMIRKFLTVALAAFLITAIIAPSRAAYNEPVTSAQINAGGPLSLGTLGVGLSYPLTINVNGSNQYLSFVGTQTWNWTSVSQNFGSGSAVNALELCSAAPCTIPAYITQYGVFNVGNVATGFPLVNLSDTTGPNFRVYGDLVAGDNVYFGSGEWPITAIANSSGLVEITLPSVTPTLSTGSQIMIAGSPQAALNNTASLQNWTVTKIDGTHFTLQGSTFTTSCSSNCGYVGTGADGRQLSVVAQGGFPSQVVIGDYQRNVSPNTDFTGSAYITICPDVTLVGLPCAQGSLNLFAYGSAGSGNFNQITFSNRSGAGSVATRWAIGSNGGLYSAGAGGTDKGADTLNTKSLYVNGALVTGAWINYTPTITASGGTPTTVSANGYYKTIDKTTVLSLDVSITAIGTATGSIVATLPNTKAVDEASVGVCRENAVTGAMGQMYVLSGGPSFFIQRYDGGSWWTNGYHIYCTITYDNT